jgi:hypothetical protein|tara:strand:- start:457 stop:585 length:129 start_codon:yes stop_codon:yes gene_type:complete
MTMAGCCESTTLHASNEAPPLPRSALGGPICSWSEQSKLELV